MKILIKSLLALLGMSCALILIAASLLHGWVVPHMDDLRPRIEAYLSERTGHSVRIGNIAAESSGLLPSFDLKNVQILDGKQNPALTLGRVQVSVSPLSLLTLELDRLTIDAPALEITRDENGQISVAGFPIRSQEMPNKGLDWIFSQKEVLIRDGTLHWIDAKPHFFNESAALPSATFNRVSLTLQNGLRSHNIRLDATPPTDWGQALQVTGQFAQPLLEAHAGHWQAWTGVIDAQIKNIPTVASLIKARIDWPLRDASIESEQLVLNSLPRLVQLAGQTFPQNSALDAALTGMVERTKLQAKDLQTTKQQIRLEVKLANTDLAGDFDVSWKKEGDKLDVTANMERLDLTALYRYVPEQTLPTIRKILQNSIQKGTASDVHATFKGSIKEFPFATSKAGAIRVTGKVSDTQLNITQKADIEKTPWSNLTQTDFLFDLNGAQLDIKNITTELAGLSSKGSIRIADVRKPVVELKAELKGALANLITLTKADPLKTLTKDIFADAEATGQMTAQLQVTMPVANPAQSKIIGQVQLQDNGFSLNAVAPPLSRIKGQINLTQTGFQLDNLRATALGGDIKLTGNSQKIIGSGIVTAEGLAAWPAMPMRAQLAPRLHGKAPYTLALDLRSGGSGLTIESSLVGMQLDLPAPLIKPTASPWPLRVQQIKLNNSQDRLSVSLSNFLALEYTRDISAGLGKPAPVVRGGIAIGTGVTASDLAIPEQGVSANLHIDQLDLGAWNQVLALDKLDASANNPASIAAASYIPSQIAATVDTLKFANRSFTQVVFGASKVLRTWRINANASDFNGYGEYRSQAGDQAGQVYLRLAKLLLPDATSKSQIEQLLQSAPDRIPALDVVIDDFEVTGKKVGRIEMLAINQKAQAYLGKGSAQEWRLQKLNITNSEATLKATGVWLPSNETNGARRVDVQFNLDVADSGSLLTRFGLPGTLKSGKGTLQGRVAWTGSPWAMHYPSLAGQLKMDMSKGQFLKIEPGGAGRFLSVLSLQALPRFLTLDFRDVFSEGFAFDSLGGDAQISDGVLATKNLQMKSVLALVSIDGSVDLTKETQNLHVLVLPDINTGGASLIATLVNPVVGAATYLAQLVLRRPVIAAATKEYNIQGSWQEPTITPLKKLIAPAP